MKTALCEFLNDCVTPFHTVKKLKDAFLAEGFTELKEGEDWLLVSGRSYFISRRAGAFVAFRVPSSRATSFQIAAAHCDSPCFLVKSTQRGNAYTRFSVEKYGGLTDATWLDRPLSFGGRVMVGKDGRIKEHLFRYDDTLLIPSLAPHLTKDKDGAALDIKTDLLPLLSDREASLDEILAVAIGCKKEEIVSKDLYVYSAQPAFLWNEGRYISSARLDDLQCVFALSKGLLAAENSRAVSVLAICNHEEIGSATDAGADSSWLSDILERIACALGKDKSAYFKMLDGSFMISADNAHAVHPAHPELSDGEDGRVYMNGGVVIKHSARRRYSTDAFSEAMVSSLCQEENIPYQHYYNRADMPGGSTLGPLSIKHLPLPTVDLGLAQLAMHSAMETAGAEDTQHLERLMRAYFSVSLAESDGSFFWMK